MTPRNYRLIISGAVELLAIASITYGAFLIAPLVGFIVCGIGLLLVARAIDPPARDSRRSVRSARFNMSFDSKPEEVF